MKYVVGLKYTNPAHEHVSLRRRVESRNTVVEASNDQEALIRASRQQRALGFIVKDAAIVDKESFTINESKEMEKDEKEKDKDEMESEDESEEEDDAGEEEDEKEDDEEDDDETMLKKTDENVESVDEAKKQLKPSYWRAEWRLGTQSEVDKNNLKIYKKLSATDPAKAKAFHDNLLKMKKKDMKEEVEQIDEVKQGKEYTKQQLVDKMKAGNWETSYDIKPGKHVELTHRSGKKVSVYVKEEMKPWVKAAQKKFDAQAKAQKMGKKQAGTLAAKKEREKMNESIMKALKKAQVKYKSAHRAAFGADPTVKSGIITGLAKLAGAKTSTARKVGAMVAGKKVTKQQQAAAASRVGKKGIAAIRTEAVTNKGEVEKKTAETRKKSIEGQVNKVNMKPQIDLKGTGDK